MEAEAREEVESKWSSRKLAVAIFTELLASLLLWKGLIEPNAWVQVTQWTVVAYLSSQGWVDSKKWSR